MRLNSFPHLALATIALATLSACANFSGIEPQATALDAKALGLSAAKTAIGGPAPRAPQPAAAPTDAPWWLAFDDAQLNSLMDQTLSTHPTLRSAQVRLQRAQTTLESASTASQPQVAGTMDMTHQRFTAHGMFPPPLAGAVLDTGTVQAAGSWELDLFGKNQAALEAAQAQVRAAQADVQLARMQLSSHLARSYFSLVRINAQLALAQRALEQRTQAQGLVQERVKAGLDTQLELEQSAGSLPEAQLQIDNLHEQRTLALNTLAALVSQPNTALTLTTPAQAAIKNIATANSIPLDLLGRRADIAAARSRIEAATQDVASAKTLFYPNINLVAFAGFSSIGFDKLLQSGSEQWGVGPAIRLPLFDAGRLRANLRGKTADLDASIEGYNALVIEAVHEVADQIASAQAIALQQTTQSAAQASAEKAYSIAVQRYKAGISNYLSVLTAETSVLVQRRLAVDLVARALDNQVQLIRALGGASTS